MANAGISYTVGRESIEQYGESYNGVQMLTNHQFPDGIDPYKIKGCFKMRLTDILPGLNRSRPCHKIPSATSL